MNESIWMPLIGGVLIGLGSILALAGSGKIPGISGIVSRVLRPQKGDIAWRWVFLGGLLLGAAIVSQLSIGWQSYTMPAGRSLIIIIIAGILVGFGTRLGGGCTSGHGVCGIGAGARDGIVYTLVFMATAIVTVLVWNLITKGAIAS